MYKNIAKQEKLMLKDQVAYQEGQVVSKTLVQNDGVSMTIFSFDKGEEISTHAAAGDGACGQKVGRKECTNQCTVTNNERKR